MSENASSSEPQRTDVEQESQIAASPSAGVDQQIEKPDEAAPVCAPTEPSRDELETDHAKNLAEVHEQLVRLETIFRNKIQLDQSREKIIERLHADLEEQKGNWIMRVLRPMSNGLIALYDDLCKTAAQPEIIGDDFQNTDSVSAFVAGLQDTVQHILYTSGFELFVTDSDEFDAACQQIVESVPTDDPDQHRKIAKRLRCGFRYEDQVARMEYVAVYKFKAPPEETESEQNQEEQRK